MVHRPGCSTFIHLLLRWMIGEETSSLGIQVDLWDWHLRRFTQCCILKKAAACTHVTQHHDCVQCSIPNGKMEKWQLSHRCADALAPSSRDFACDVVHETKSGLFMNDFLLWRHANGGSWAECISFANQISFSLSIRKIGKNYDAPDLIKHNTGLGTGEVNEWQTQFGQMKSH